MVSASTWTPNASRIPLDPLVWLEIDGFFWFRLVLFHAPGPSVFQEGHLSISKKDTYGPMHVPLIGRYPLVVW